MGYEVLPSSSAVDDGDEESGGGNMKAPWQLPPLFVGNGRLTVGIGPQSTGGRMRVGRNEGRDCRCGANKMGCIDVNGVNVERNADK